MQTTKTGMKILQETFRSDNSFSKNHELNIFNSLPLVLFISLTLLLLFSYSCATKQGGIRSNGENEKCGIKKQNVVFKTNIDISSIADLPAPGTIYNFTDIPIPISSNLIISKMNFTFKEFNPGEEPNDFNVFFTRVYTNVKVCVDLYKTYPNRRLIVSRTFTNNLNAPTLRTFGLLKFAWNVPYCLSTSVQIDSIRLLDYISIEDINGYWDMTTKIYLNDKIVDISFNNIKITNILLPDNRHQLLYNHYHQR